MDDNPILDLAIILGCLLLCAIIIPLLVLGALITAVAWFILWLQEALRKYQGRDEFRLQGRLGRRSDAVSRRTAGQLKCLCPFSTI